MSCRLTSSTGTGLQGLSEQPALRLAERQEPLAALDAGSDTRGP